MIKVTFPETFTWGVATSAYQVEGYPLENGACPSNWHEFTHLPGKVMDGTNGDIACDHYHRYPEDIRTMADMGLKGYRFSIAWSRIVPEPGTVSQKGLDFYDRFIDAILDAGIQPWATIFHLEEPQWIARSGGMTNRASVDFLVDFGTTLMRRFGDRVKNWITINEPTIYAWSCFAIGEFPPGRKNDLRGMLRSIHHLLLAHARLCGAFSSIVPGGMIGLAHHFLWVSPADPAREKDREAAAFMDDAANGMVLDPLFRGRYPPRVARKLGRFLPRGFEKDLVEMEKPGTYMGINYYTRNRYRYSFFMPFLHAAEYIDPHAPRSGMWEIYPPGIFKALIRLKDEYGNLPCVITENGYPAREERDPLDDPERIAYLSDHVALVGKAIEQGVDCRGYFVWSLLDNFEWNWGLQMRTGLLRTDYATLQRQWKKSAYWYRDLARRNWLEVDKLPLES
jgi:beta-glucosidase